MHLCVYSSIIYNSQDTETISMSTNRLMDEDVVYAHNGILLSHKKECIWVSSNEVDEPRAWFSE